MLANGRSLVKGIISQENMKKKKSMASFQGMIVGSQIPYISYGVSKLITEAQWKICICESTLQLLADFYNNETLETDWRTDLRKKFSITIHALKRTASESPLSSDHLQSTALKMQAGHRAAVLCPQRNYGGKFFSSGSVLRPGNTDLYLLKEEIRNERVPKSFPFRKLAEDL